MEPICNERKRMSTQFYVYSPVDIGALAAAVAGKAHSALFAQRANDTADDVDPRSQSDRPDHQIAATLFCFVDQDGYELTPDRVERVSDRSNSSADVAGSFFVDVLHAGGHAPGTKISQRNETEVLRYFDRLLVLEIASDARLSGSQRRKSHLRPPLAVRPTLAVSAAEPRFARSMLHPLHSSHLRLFLECTQRQHRCDIAIELMDLGARSCRNACDRREECEVPAGDIEAEADILQFAAVRPIVAALCAADLEQEHDLRVAARPPDGDFASWQMKAFRPGAKGASEGANEVALRLRPVQHVDKPFPNELDLLEYVSSILDSRTNVVPPTSNLDLLRRKSNAKSERVCKKMERIFLAAQPFNRAAEVTDDSYKRILLSDTHLNNCSCCADERRSWSKNQILKALQ